MPTSEKIIVVAGANGELGKLLCAALLERAKMNGETVVVRALVRKAPAAGQEVVDYASSEDLRRVCAGAYCVVSTLQGLDDVIIGVQSRLLEAAIAGGARRFIPSDFSMDLTKLAEGSQRNLDLRRRFHGVARDLIGQAKSPLELTSVYQGAFTELVATGWVLFNYKKHQVTYFGSPDTLLQYTTWKNTAEFTAAVALDANATPASLYIAGQQLTAKDAQQIAKKANGVEFALKRMMSVPMLGRVIKLLKLFKPGKGDVFPMWVGMQYAYCMALGVTIPARLDNDRYKGIQWTGIEEIFAKAFREAEAKKT